MSSSNDNGVPAATPMPPQTPSADLLELGPTFALIRTMLGLLAQRALNGRRVQRTIAFEELTTIMHLANLLGSELRIANENEGAMALKKATRRKGLH